MFGPHTIALTERPRYVRRRDDVRFHEFCRGAVMTTFDKREEAFEQQFAHDEELRFKATARRNKMLGLWAAEKLGLAGAEADSYALSVVMAAFGDADAPDVMHKIRKDFDAKGVAQSDHQITRQMTELMAQAIIDIKAGR
jgi:hypothetical protein